MKRSIKERFGVRKVKADTSGLTQAALLPPVHLLQVDEHFRNGWIDYSALDAKVGLSLVRFSSHDGFGLHDWSAGAGMVCWGVCWCVAIGMIASLLLRL
jgi:hypothetical protein